MARPLGPPTAPALLLALCLALAGCGAGTPGALPSGPPTPPVVTGTAAPAPEAAPTPRASATTPGPPATPQPPEPSPEALTPEAEPETTLTVALAGDVHAEAGIAEVLRAGGNPLGEVAALLRAADVAVVNLETAVATTGTPADKQFTFNAPAGLPGALAEAGVDVVSVANNHSLDFGAAALAETVTRAREAGLLVAGAGDDAAEAYAPAVVEVSGRRVAVVGLSRVLPIAAWAAGPDHPGLASAYDEAAAAEAVARAAGVADHVIAFVHWGLERTPCPVDHQVRLAEALLDAGADVVAGHHPHVLQGVDRRDARLVAYSLGNFLFYAGTEETRSGGVLYVTLGDGGVLDARFEPVVLDGPGLPRPATPEEAERISALVAARSPGGSACPWP